MRNSINNLVNFFINCFLAERNNWFHWIPVLFGGGILLYFKLSSEISIAIILVIIFLLLVFFLLQKNESIKLFILTLCIFYAGVAIIAIKANNISAPILSNEDKFFVVKARVDSVQHLSTGKRLIFHDIDIGLPQDKTPKKIRVMFRTNISDVSIGDYVSFKANLSRPSKSITPDGYDFARNAFFSEIGAVGYALSNIVIIKKATQNYFLDKLNVFRYDLEKNIIKVLGNSEGSIVTALVIGEYGAMPKSLLEKMRISGLAHIMAVSGLHLTLVTSIIFFVVRILLSRFEYLMLRYNIQKISALMTIILSFFYLLLTGVHVAATRAFIMTSLFFGSLIFDRFQVGLRPVCIACLFILIINPEYIVQPSFQMSFAAVISLISIYNLLSKQGLMLYSSNVIKKIMFYIISMVCTSLIAGLAVAPFAAYHFHQFSKYTVLANLLVIPIMSIYIMPLVLLSIIFYNSFLFEFITIMLGKGISYIIFVADFVSSMSYSYNIVPNVSDISLALMTLGGLWLLLWEQKWRFLGIIGILVGVINIYYQDFPDVILDQDPGKIIFVNSKKQVISLSKIRSKIKHKAYANFLGHEQMLDYSELNESSNEIKCSNDICFFSKNNKHVVVDYNTELKTCYNDYDIIIVPNIYNSSKICPHSSIFDNMRLSKYGTHFLFLKKNIIINTSKKPNLNRLWS